MVDAVTSSVLGNLRDNGYEYWESEPVAIPFFDNVTFPLTCNFVPDSDPSFMRDADAAIANFLGLDRAYRLSISAPVYEYAMQCIENTDFSDDAHIAAFLKDPDIPVKVWTLVMGINEIIVARREQKNDRDIYVALDCLCRWEDHGLRMVFRQGRKLTRVNIPDGWMTDIDAFAIPETQDTLWSEF